MIRHLLCAVAAMMPVAGASGEMAPTIAASLREPGPLLVLDCGEDRPHRELARKIADDLRPLRGGDRPASASADRFDDLLWERAHVLILCSDPADPALLAMAPGLGFGIRDGLEIAGIPLRGHDAGALVSLPHPRSPGLWVMAMVGDGPAALRRLDRHIRNDIAASVMMVDDEGERFASLQRQDGGWGVLPGHPYRADAMRALFRGWREETAAHVTAWDLDVDVRRAGSIAVDAAIEVERRATPEVWLQLTPRARLTHCDGSCIPYDSRDGRQLIRIEPSGERGRIGLGYEVPLPGHLEAWSLGPAGGYVLPSANWFPRVLGEVDDPYLARGTWSVDLLVDPGSRAVQAGDVPLLVWGRFREIETEEGRRALLPPGAPAEVEERARLLLRWVDRHEPRLRQLVAVDREAAWCGGDVLLAPPTLLEPGAVDDLDELMLHRALTEQSVRLTEPTGRPVRVRGTVAVPQQARPRVTVRLWRLRGAWWQQVDEGPLDEDGWFELSGKLRGTPLVSAEAPGHVPAAVQLPARGRKHDADLHLEPVEAAALVCLRCGPDLRAERYPMRAVSAGRFEVEIALGEMHRSYGSFPYAIEVNPGGERTVLLLDPRRRPDQFPSFLDPGEFHADTIVVTWDAGAPRYWIEVPGGLLAPEGWISPSSLP